MNASSVCYNGEREKKRNGKNKLQTENENANEKW